ncbi:MAG: phosphocholine cytidylyltransferase family protein [Thermoplasmata archaeon]|nr:phosphocholine cytidylyltransferase family protein [Thermoplasmata archaeon]
MLAVILAAGRGSRLAEITEKIPKCLVEIAGKSIIERQMESLEKHDLDEIYVVAGYKAEMVKEVVGDKANVILNKDYHITDNIYSLYLSKENVYGKDFILMNGDVIFDGAILKKMVENGNMIAVSRKYDEEALKVRIDNRRVMEILPKETEEEESDASISGIFKFSSQASKLLFDEIEKDINSGVKNKWFEHALNRILDREKFEPVYVDGYRCIEIDTMEDLKKAGEMWV